MKVKLYYVQLQKKGDNFKYYMSDIHIMIWTKLLYSHELLALVPFCAYINYYIKILIITY